jgi:2-polyprenyl-6-hydroxyphenyl methylase/3-demethylubiquinone-9 3-methyltransferase
MTNLTAQAAFENEVNSGQRFEFGKNWAKFLLRLNTKRIEEAEDSLRKMLGYESLKGKTFLDIGCGSGLFSLAASRLDASSIHSLDFDSQSVACCSELKTRFFPDKKSWTIEQASILDENYLKSLKNFDIVYSWGVLHHTGAMWQAIENTCDLVNPGGLLFIAIYNDQGYVSKFWLWIKKTYNRLHPSIRFLILYPSFLILWIPIFLRDLLTGKPGKTWKEYIRDRGMSPWEDVVDWVGGLPFEVASPETIFAFIHSRGFSLENLKTTQNLGCNEFVFKKVMEEQINQVFAP